TSSREASVQRSEAERARQQAATQRQIAESAQARAADIHQDLTAESRMRRALEEEIQRLEREYQSSRMTREDLVAWLARTEGELRLLEQRHADSNRTAARELVSAQEERDRARSQAAE